MWIPFDMDKVPGIWKIQTSFAAPVSVRFVVIETFGELVYE